MRSSKRREEDAMKQSRIGKTFMEARLGMCRTMVGRYSPITRRELAGMALEKYGPIRAPITCRRKSIDEPEPLARWMAKIRLLEASPGRRALCDESARRLCELLGIKLIEQEEYEIDLRIAA